MSQTIPTHRAKYRVYVLVADGHWELRSERDLPYSVLAGICARLAKDSNRCFGISYNGRLVERFLPPVTKPPKPMCTAILPSDIERKVTEHNTDYHYRWAVAGGTDFYHANMAVTALDQAFSALLADRQERKSYTSEWGQRHA